MCRGAITGEERKGQFTQESLMYLATGGSALSDAGKDTIKMKRSLKSSIKSLNILGILLAFLVLCVIMAIASPAFLKQTNLLNILQQISINFTIAIGMTFVILIGGIDLSVGSITALTGMFVAIMMKNWNIPVAPAIIIAVLSASLLGLINGVLISGLDLPPFIVTLGMMELARGMSYTVTAGSADLYAARRLPRDLRGASAAFRSLRC